MTASFLRRASGLLPPPVRRAASGLLVDLRALPARFADPERRGDPWAIAHNVGGGDYRAVGRAILQTLIAEGGLGPADRVLDVGCGTGRVALQLAGYLDPGAGYVGFDVSRRAIGHCRRTIARGRPDFRFVHADVSNYDYNSRGRIAESDYIFPAETESIDFAFATSVFSHMRIESIAHYLSEAARALRTGGRFAFTAYVLTPARREATAAGDTRVPFAPWGDKAMVVDPRSPERAIAHDAAAIEALVAAAGLTLKTTWLRGGWAGDATYEGFQDLFVAVR